MKYLSIMLIVILLFVTLMPNYNAARYSRNQILQMKVKYYYNTTNYNDSGNGTAATIHNMENKDK